MFQFNSKPVQVSNDLVLCQDGSLWLRVNSTGFYQVGEYKGKVKNKEASEDSYSPEFEVFWQVWTDLIRLKDNPSNKMQSFKKWRSLNVLGISASLFKDKQ
jgi:hypothetical protein